MGTGGPGSKGYSVKLCARNTFFSPKLPINPGRAVLEESSGRDSALLAKSPKGKGARGGVRHLASVFCGCRAAYAVARVPTTCDEERETNHDPGTAGLSMQYSFQALKKVFQGSSNNATGERTNAGHRPQLPVTTSKREYEARAVSCRPHYGKECRPRCPPSENRQQALPFTIQSNKAGERLLLLLPPLPDTGKVQVLR